jgi:hypothetical protein
MKQLLKIVTLTALFSQTVYAASCDIDQTQMQAQISQYASINTQGCPFNQLEWGINQVKNVQNVSSTKCSATCVYASGPGSQGVDCTWEKGNWGDTLACN